MGRAEGRVSSRVGVWVSTPALCSIEPRPVPRNDSRVLVPLAFLISGVLMGIIGDSLGTWAAGLFGPQISTLRRYISIVRHLISPADAFRSPIPRIIIIIIVVVSGSLCVGSVLFFGGVLQRLRCFLRLGWTTPVVRLFNLSF